jgi:hypothetical protein
VGAYTQEVGLVGGAVGVVLYTNTRVHNVRGVSPTLPCNQACLLAVWERVMLPYPLWVSSVGVMRVV